MSKFISPRFSNLDAYTPGEQPRERKYIKLNTNESPFPPSPNVIDAVKNESTLLNLYPDPTAKTLKSVIADAHLIKPENVFVANGSDEVLALSFMAFCDNTVGVAFPEISYGFYKVYADLFSLEYNAIPLCEDFTINQRDYFNLNKTIFIANPNAPTGICLSLEQIKEILDNNRSNLVVIDEAYVDFGGDSVVRLIDKYDNLLVVRTFSKSRNLAGGRIGFAMGNKDIIADLELMKYSFNPYNVNRLSLVSATEAILDKEYFEECVSKIINNRSYLINELNNLGFEILPSSANFIFAKNVKIGGEELYLKLKENGILVRHFSNQKICDYVRITIGTKEELIELVRTIEKIISEVA